ncbi:MAG: hypothetical protein ACF8TS_19170 [Maioricimonas sp. JB049]
MQRRHRNRPHRGTPPTRRPVARRGGAAVLDYVLALGVVLPLLAIVLPISRRIMQLVFEMTCTLIAWPFM